MSMTDYEKAERIIAVLARISRRAVYLEPEDVLEKCTKQQLERYFEGMCIKC